MVQQARRLTRQRSGHPARVGCGGGNSHTYCLGYSTCKEAAPPAPLILISNRRKHRLSPAKTTTVRIRPESGRSMKGER